MESEQRAVCVCSQNFALKYGRGGTKQESLPAQIASVVVDTTGFFNGGNPLLLSLNLWYYLCMNNPFKRKTKKVRFSSQFKGSNITDSQTGSVNKPECSCDCKNCSKCAYTFKK